MSERVILGTKIEVDPEGYFKDSGQWSPEIAEQLATEAGINLTDQHLKVIHFLRDRYKSGQPLTIRRVGKSGLVTIKEFYQLFPGGPLKVSSKIAGIPKPASCI